MRVNLQGFSWTLGSRGVSADDLFKALAETRTSVTRYGDYDRMIFVGEKGRFYTGLFLTIKDQRRFCQLQRERGSVKISVKDLGKGNSIVDFNFFVILKSTLRGIYQHYHHSCGLNQFAGFCKTFYNSLRNEKKRAEIEEAGDSPSGRTMKEINQRYKGTLKSAFILREATLESLLGELKKIKACEYEFTTLKDSDSIVTPLDDYIRAKTVKAKIQAEAPLRGVRQGIVDFYNKFRLKKLSVAGTDHDGLEQVFRLFRNIDCFGNYEYDKIADDEVLDLGNIQDSPLLRDMISKVEENGRIFSAPIRE